MRDDLHKTVPAPRHWKTVLRYAPSKLDRATRLVDALQNAVRRDLANAVRPTWIQGLREALAPSREDLFAQDLVRQETRRYEVSIESPIEREIHECVRAVDAGRNDAVVWAYRTVAARVMERQCEQLISGVRQEHPNDVPEVRRVLNSACLAARIDDLIDGEGNLAATKRRPRKAIDLDETIE